MTERKTRKELLQIIADLDRALVMMAEHCAGVQLPLMVAFQIAAIREAANEAVGEKT